ncbi:MAG: amino acid ABC transporter permease [Erysipelotrichaceae bacterium]|jgi:putative lysine transport system permease protein|nr:amino acid ABC transporter permease [Erysipelotrichaceae bacterium]MBP1530205.1 amino acid ABC transporter permease [Erysipelotrichaceae bacterium]MBQ1322743.1 amino acid ABC transporter permease [Erysipelotrichaceae bacterium]MBQ1378567.1 amino acid ABC transporter permease [Erysipelotrichaceae bacterium]MBQ1775545.1 amino acid ABC transporter permease [Erysipelotrichaceae bacterium]
MLKDALFLLTEYKEYFIKGTLNTLLFSFSGTAIGILIGLCTGIIRTAPESKNPVLRVIQKIVNALIYCYVEVFRGTPMMVQSMVIYWGYAFATGGKTLDLTLSAIMIISINTGAYMTEIVRGGIISIDKGQFEAASAIGMNHTQTMTRIIIPQVIRNILPSTSNELLNNIKDSSVLNVIGATELFFNGGLIGRKKYMIFQSYLVVSVIYLCITLIVTNILRKFEKVLEGNEDFLIVPSQTISQVNGDEQ